MTPGPEFRPLRRASPLWRLVALSLLSLIWIVALVVLAVALDRVDAVEFAFILLGASFAAGLVVLGLGRARRGHAERDA